MNARRLHPILWSLIFLLMEVPAQSCGPDWPDAVFVKTQSPDNPYEAFARGHLGVPQPGYRVRHLVVVYRYLNGLPLSHDEQTAAVNANKQLNSDWENDQLRGHEGFQSWIEARKSFGPVDGFIPQSPFGTQDVWMMNSYFENCLDDAFANATRALHARQQSYGNHSSDIVDWVRGQDAVFHNCDRPQSTPAVLSASAPQWLRYDRAYQQAAALFYQDRYDDALKAFSAIASDSHSPWSSLSRYLVGRIMVTRAVNLEAYSPPFNQNQTNEPPPAQRLNTYLDQLKAARTELLQMRHEPQMQPLTHAIDAMIDRANARLEPELQTRTLAMRLTAPAPDPNFYQHVLDLTYLLGSNYSYNDSALLQRPKVVIPLPSTAADRRADDMIAWIQCLHTGNQQSIREHWNDAHTTPWLIAALTLAKPDDPANAELLSAAAAIQPGGPAYPAAVYHRIRLSPINPTTRAELLAVLPELSANETTSTRNLFEELNARSAPDLNTWLQHAARKPAAESTYGEEDEFDNTPAPQPCGPALLDKNTPLFAPDVATVLNTRLPLRLLAQAAKSTVLPPNLRFQVAQAAWTRAVLLDRPNITAQLSPILIRCNSKWQPVLSDYDNASSPKDRKAAALFALMRFASTEPNVREGNYRVDGFAAYSLYRDNWWCFTIPPTQKANSTQPEQYDPDSGWGFTSLVHPEIPDPLFLTSADRAEAAREIAALRRIPKASAYLPAQAFAWQRAYPDDARAPELLGQAFRVIRNACTDKSSSDIEHRLFLTLHQRYPANHWTLRYKTWE